MSVEPSPRIKTFYEGQLVTLTLDSGANASMVSEETVKRLGIPISTTTHIARQADQSLLQVVGEAFFTVKRGPISLYVEALVVRNLNCDILAGMPLLRKYDVIIDIPGQRIQVSGKYNISMQHMPTNRTTAGEAHIIRCYERRVLLPGEYMDFNTPFSTTGEQYFVIEPRSNTEPTWPKPDMITILDGHFCLTNDTNEALVLKKNQHVALIRPVVTSDQLEPRIVVSNTSTNDGNVPRINPASTKVSIDPDKLLDCNVRHQFNELHRQYEGVFEETIGKYNDASGRIRATVNIGKANPPKSKGMLPNYARGKMDEMQRKCDHLEHAGVLAKPEDVGVQVEYVSPSLLIPKNSGGDRFVTSFNGIASYIKAPPSRSTSSEDVLLFLSKWKFMIKTDMTDQFFQLPLAKAAMKYMGIVTPYKGIRCYTRAAMGMPGSSEFLDELMYRVLGELMHEGCLAKLADDLYIGGNTPEELLHNWQRTLEIFQVNNLRLSARKTIICPKTTVVLGWVWSQGQISVSPHKVTPLATSHYPETVKALRSWIGAFKHMKACISQYSALLSSLEEAVGGKDSRSKLVWTEELKMDFTQAQEALKNLKTITIPKPSDQLVIQTDGSVKNRGIGAILHIIRGEKVLLGGYFSAKLKPYQQRWLPCEVEGIAISAAVQNWTKLIRESEHYTQVLSDSKPCIQAYVKLKRGEFSASARVTAFLATLSSHRVTLQHIAGKINLGADYQSRNPVTCTHENCQMCRFVAESQSEVESASISMQDVLERKSNMPYTNPNAWRETQLTCPDLRRVYAHLRHGTRPSKKTRESIDVKRYLRSATLGKEGLIVVQRQTPYAPVSHLTVVPKTVIKGLLTALHVKLQHPSMTQLRKVFDRHFFALDAEAHIRDIQDHCHQCTSLRTLPRERPEFSTSQPDNHPGQSFSMDVLRRQRQKICVLRDNFSSFTYASFVNSEGKDDLREFIVKSTSLFALSDKIKIRVDCATAFQALSSDTLLESSGIVVELGDRKNINKNPIAEKAVAELEIELRKTFPDGRAISDTELQKVVRRLNLRIRNRGYSAHEILFCRNTLDGQQMTFEDSDLQQSQHHIRVGNHQPSAKCKEPKGRPLTPYKAKPGELVFVKSDGDKHTARDQYLVITRGKDSVSARKLHGLQFRTNLYTLKDTQIFPCSQNQNCKPADIELNRDDDPELDYTTNRQYESEQNDSLSDADTESESLDESENDLENPEYDDDASGFTPLPAVEKTTRSGRISKPIRDPNCVYYHTETDNSQTCVSREANPHPLKMRRREIGNRIAKFRI